MLLHICVHGSMQNGAPATRWIPDAVVILQTSGSLIDWDRLLEEAKKRSFVWILQHAFRSIDDILSDSIPSDFREHLHATPVAYRERLEYRVRLLDKWRMNEWGIHSRGTCFCQRWVSKRVLLMLSLLHKNREPSAALAVMFLFTSSWHASHVAEPPLPPNPQK